MTTEQATSVFSAPPPQDNAPPPQDNAPPQDKPAQQSAPPPEGWFGKLSAEDKAWAESKGWKSDTDPMAILQSYQNLEKVFGADKAGRTVMLPKDENDKAALDAIYEKLGRPKEASEYEIELPPNADPAFSDAAKNWFHKAGLTKAQAAAVTESYKALELDAANRVQTEHAQQVEGLQKEWGAQYEQKVEIAKAGLKAAGLEEAQVRAVEQAVGPAAAAKMFEFFGRNYVEAGPPDRETRSTPGFGAISPGAALQKMTQLRADPNFMARYDNSDPKIRMQAIEEMNSLALLAQNARA